MQKKNCIGGKKKQTNQLWAEVANLNKKSDEQKKLPTENKKSCQPKKKVLKKIN